MKSDRLKRLAKIRLILSAIAVFLAGLMIVSGVMHFVTNAKGPSEEAPAEPTAPLTTVFAETASAPETEAPETIPSTEATEPTTAPETEETTEDETAPSVTAPVVDVGKQDIGTSDGNSSKPHSPKPTDPANDGNGPSNGTSDDNAVIPPSKDDDNAVIPPSKDDDIVVIPPSKDDDIVVIPPSKDDDIVNTPDSAPSHSLFTSDGPTAPYPEDAVPHDDLIAPVTEVPAPPAEEESGSNFWAILFWSSAGLLAADLLAIVLISRQIQEEKKRLRRIRKSLAGTDAHAQNPGQAPRPVMQPVSDTEMPAAVTQIGTIHQMGRREYQQDSLGHTAVLGNRGLLAIVADGMGGLSGGEKVSQKIVMDALAFGHQLQPGQANGALWQMVETVNANVNRALGPDGLYKSGSTMIAVLVYDGKFQWISVGDSRIYLYRQGYANQLNQDHDQLQVWMADVLSGRRTIEETLRNPDGRKLTSFLGMGQLKYVDGSRGSIALEPGDRLVLMSDGVYNIIPEDRLAEILRRNPDAEKAASVLDRMIRDSNHPHQDNYTAIILAF